MTMGRSPMDLAKNPEPPKTSGKPDAPVTVVIRDLMTDSGKPLEILTRTNPHLAKAAQICYIFGHQIADENGELGNQYVNSRMEQIERLAISMNGKGRDDLIAALNAGGRLPDSYYQTKSPGFSALPGDEAPGNE